MILFNPRYLTSRPWQAARGRLAVGFTLTALTALLLGLFPAPASADLVLSVGNASAQAGGTGSFDVVLSATNSETFQVAGFSVELAVAPSSGVSFTAASALTTTAPYIFTTLQLPPLTFSSFPNYDFIASDSYLSSPGYVTLSAPVTVGLENVSFAVAAGTPAGDVPVSILGIGVTTEILDNNGNPIPFDAMNGTITVTSSTVVPEPSSLVTGLTSLALVGGAIALKRRRSPGRLSH